MGEAERKPIKILYVQGLRQNVILMVQGVADNSILLVEGSIVKKIIIGGWEVREGAQLKFVSRSSGCLSFPPPHIIHHTARPVVTDSLNMHEHSLQGPRAQLTSIMSVCVCAHRGGR